ncbi:MAG: tetratricopeptide repeat protein [Bacteroidales bacterium]|nr:tetratricopeptide repeat protein [Bacteroidales bacterium]
MKSFKILIIIFSILLIFARTVNSQDLFDSTHTLKYANYLYQSGDYKQAISEFERFIFKYSEEDNIKLRLVKAYRKAGKTESALERMDNLWDKPYKQSPDIAKEVYILRILDKADTIWIKDISENPVLRSDDKILLSSTILLLNDKYERARELLSDNHDFNRPEFKSLMKLSEQGENLKYKSPLLSGILSTVLPGAGKVYTGNWENGLISLIMVSSSAYQSYKGFEKYGTESVYGWIFGAIGVGFYFGNIHGSVKAANRYNFNNKNRIRESVQGVFYNSI